MQCSADAGRVPAGDGRPAGWPDEPVYLDYNATTPADARVAEATRSYLDQWFGNQSAGQRASSPGSHQ
jgi:selenocysteine lyase/cysteine desulfurase